MITKSFRYGEKIYNYDIRFSPIRTGKIAIHVHPNAAIQVEAPENRDLNAIHNGVLKRARWITRNVENAIIRNTHVLPRHYVSGETVFYLGRRYQLKIRQSGQGSGDVKLRGGYLQVACPDPHRDQVKKQVKKWYRDRARIIIARRLLKVSEDVLWLDEIPSWKLRSMKKQWGSCSPKGGLLINPHLIKAPGECIDYVLRHEICHLKEHNHSKKYYRLLSDLMPQWPSVKSRLDGMAELLLNE